MTTPIPSSLFTFTAAAIAVLALDPGADGTLGAEGEGWASSSALLQDTGDRSFGFGQDPHLDGDRIAFTMRGDIWTVRVDGSDPRQLTHHSGGDWAVTWTPDSEPIVLRSGRGSLQWHQPLYSVAVHGDLPVRLPLGAAIDGTYPPDGATFAFNRTRTPAPKRNYRGSTAGSVWLADLTAAENTDLPGFRQLTNTDLEASQSHANDAVPMFATDGRIYFKSERDGVYNLWRVTADGGEPEQVTSHQRGGVQFPSPVTDGRTIAYVSGFELWDYEIGSEALRAGNGTR